MFVISFTFLCVLVSKVTSLDFVSKNNLNSSLQVKTQNGVIQGTEINIENDQTAYAYFGIPYAEPPVNNLRFRAPKPLGRRWSGVLNASKEGNTCVEFLFFTKNWDVVGNEDCLYLNVYTPKLPQKVGRPLAVMVWIYGGAFREGNSKYSFYNPSYLLTGNAIVVTFNYRVGALGFLNTGDLQSPGNYGLKDQNLALKWVKENIVYFGGNNKKITIFGESAGSVSVCYHLLSEKSRGLFHGAILESGTSLSIWGLQTDPKKLAFEFGLAVGIDTKNSTKLMEALRRTDIVKIKYAIPRLFVANIYLFGGQTTFAPSIEPDHENAFLTKHSYAAFQSGNFTKVPLIFGINTQEAKLFISFLKIEKNAYFLTDLSPQLLITPEMNIKSLANKREIGTSIINHYFKSGSFVGADLKEIAQYVSDDQFIKPILKTSELTSVFTPSYIYLFSYEGPLGINSVKSTFHVNPGDIDGTAHSEEMFYLWKVENAKVRNRITQTDKDVIKIMIKLWTNFAKNGNPTLNKEEILQNITWTPTSSINNFTYLQIDKKLTLKQNYRKEHIDFWNNLYQKYSNGPIDTY